MIEKIEWLLEMYKFWLSIKKKEISMWWWKEIQVEKKMIETFIDDLEDLLNKDIDAN